MSRPALTPRETQLLFALQLMKIWVVNHTVPVISGNGEQYAALKRDVAIAEKAVSEATGGNEQ